MTQTRGIGRGHLAILMLVASTLLPLRARAEVPDASLMFDYGFKGFTLGAEVGLAIGYLSTGPTYQTEEWRRLVLGAGIGALSGLTAGMVFAVSDTNNAQSVGYFMIRDGNYGSLFGAGVGALAGVLFWIDDGTKKDVLVGTAIGTLGGAFAGIIYGIIEGNTGVSTRTDYWGGYSKKRSRDFQVNLMPVPGPNGPLLAASMRGRF